MYSAEWDQGQHNIHLTPTRSSVVVQYFEIRFYSPKSGIVGANLEGPEFAYYPYTWNITTRGAAGTVLTEVEAAHCSATGQLRVTGESRCQGVP